MRQQLEYSAVSHILLNDSKNSRIIDAKGIRDYFFLIRVNCVLINDIYLHVRHQILQAAHVLLFHYPVGPLFFLFKLIPVKIKQVDLIELIMHTFKHSITFCQLQNTFRHVSGTTCLTGLVPNAHSCGSMPNN